MCRAARRRRSRDSVRGQRWPTQGHRGLQRAGPVAGALPGAERGGPCLDSYKSGELVFNSDLTANAPWPEFAAECVAAGFPSVCAVPLRLQRRDTRMSNLFMSEPLPLSDADVQLARALADVATIAVVQDHATRASASREGHLRHHRRAGRHRTSQGNGRRTRTGRHGRGVRRSPRLRQEQQSPPDRGRRGGRFGQDRRCFHRSASSGGPGSHSDDIDRRNPGCNKYHGMRCVNHMMR